MTARALPEVIHSAFYRFTRLDDPAATAEALRARSRDTGVLGSLVVATEGLSGVVAGPVAAVTAFEAALTGDPVFGGAFADLHFKRSPCTTAPFARMKVHVKPEIVALGLEGVSGLDETPAQRTATHLGPAAWQALLADDTVVVLDNRNRFEWRLGRFRGAVDPGVDNFRDFAELVRTQAPHWKARGQRVAMYCTGGIRCEKTGVWMREALGLEVFQLDGGILNYLEQTAGQSDDTWRGECFVFDNRIALDAQLRETATTAEQVYDPAQPGEAWRLERARRLDTATGR
ncbi:rhodanese-like domain-containing protein [Sphaerotilus sp.]|uniref:oxygen-dependent tRNA uridine(34) hydroxylase TrhO n=1 Tax=Sphaerotilus sp. TaxID=2093942 RepID=UPI0034E2BE3C